MTPCRLTVRAFLSEERWYTRSLKLPSVDFWIFTLLSIFIRGNFATKIYYQQIFPLFQRRLGEKHRLYRESFTSEELLETLLIRDRETLVYFKHVSKQLLRVAYRQTTDDIFENASPAFYLVISGCIGKLKDCGPPLRVEIQDPRIQDAKLERCRPPSSRPTSASRQREGSRFERSPPRRLAPPRYTPSLECNYAFGFDVVARRWSRVMTAPRRLIGETSLRARAYVHIYTHAEGMDALSERGWLEAGWWRESKAGRQEVAVSGGERIDSVRMLRGCLTASRTRIPLIRHIVKCNYRGGLSGPRITDPPWRPP